MTDHRLSTESDRARLMGYIAGLDLSKPRKVAITEEDRSAEQNAKLHAMLSDISRQVEHAGHPGDDGQNVDNLHPKERISHQAV